MFGAAASTLLEVPAKIKAHLETKKLKGRRKLGSADIHTDNRTCWYQMLTQLAQDARDSYLVELRTSRPTEAPRAAFWVLTLHVKDPW